MVTVMSQIASLYVVPDSAIPAICMTAMPQKAGWFSKPHDTFWQTLWDLAGKNCLDCDAPGSAFSVLIEYLSDRHVFDMRACESSDFATFLSKARKSSFLTVSPAQAAELSSRLAVPFDAADLTPFVIDFCGPEDHQDMVAAILEAAKALPHALEQVHSGTTGLITIG